MFEVIESTLEEVVKVHKNVVEFMDMNKEDFEVRIHGSKNIIIVAYYNNIPVGYMIGYDRDKDDSFYCWLAGVDNNYRRKGILKELMNYQINWAKNNGYQTLKIKTRNNKREMLSFLVKNGFNLVSVEVDEDIKENRINLELTIM